MSNNFNKIANTNKEKYIITFDLLTGKDYEEKLKNEQNLSLSSMYDIIKRHMLKNDFYWQQDSTYISNNLITFRQFRRIIEKLYKNNKWLSDYTRDMTNGIIKDINLLDFTNIINKYKKEYKEEQKSKNTTKSKTTLRP